MKICYIGQFSDGSTSKMRADTLQQLLGSTHFEVIDTNVPFYASGGLIRSIGFRYKRGPLISRVNQYILSKLKGPYDLIWVDKAVYLKESTTKILRNLTSRMVHFTPDMAFYENRSRHFFDSILYYDFLITTKTEELGFYSKKVNKDKIIYCTQGFSKAIHQKKIQFEERENSIAFIGLHESSREEVIKKLILSGIKVCLAGKGWGKFVSKYAHQDTLVYYGEGVYNEEYVNLLNRSKFGLGMLSKRFPELHTTRTFEIPACGTVLLTEDNLEIRQVFNDDEVVFYRGLNELIEKLTYLIQDDNALKTIAEKGHQRVTKGGYDYTSIMKRVIDQIGL